MSYLLVSSENDKVSVFAHSVHADLKANEWVTAALHDVPGGRVALSAFRFPFEIAAEAHVVSANVAWALPRSGWFDGITCYNNLSTTRGVGAGSDDSWQNVAGCSFAKGKSFTYVDLISGRNMWFIGGPGIALQPGDDAWRTRLNINLGFYF